MYGCYRSWAFSSSCFIRFYWYFCFDMIKRCWWCILWCCSVFLSMMTIGAEDLHLEQKMQIEQASQRIISLMKQRGDYYGSQLLNTLEYRRIHIRDEKKKKILSHIQYLVSWYISCQNYDGERLDEYFECEYLSKEYCTKIGGQYTHCASACRHVQVSICLLPCKEVCSLRLDDE